MIHTLTEPAEFEPKELEPAEPDLESVEWPTVPELEQIDITTEPTTHELKSCDHSNIMEPNVSQQQLSSLDASIPHEPSSINKSQVKLEPSLRVLPNRTTRGVPKVSYEPVFNSTRKYPLSIYVSYHRLSKACASFANQLSTVYVPNSVQETIKDPKWKDAMNEKMKSLKKMQHERWLIYLLERNLLGVD